MRDSIFYATLRAFFISLAAVLGALIALTLLIFGIAALSDSSTSDPEKVYSLKIAANAEGERKSLSSSSPVILKINISGIIGANQLTHEGIREMLTESREGELKKDRVKAILLHINSPGGTVFDADGIYRSIKAYKEKYHVPVYAIIDGMCASGGYYIAMAADKIYASETSLVGSIGVIMPSFVNVSKLLEKIGVDSLTIYAGKGKDELNPLRPWKEDEGENIKTLVENYYNQFLTVVTENKPEVTRENLINVYGSNVYIAEKAQSQKMIDASGYNLGQTIKELARQIGIEDNFYQVIELKKKTWLYDLFDSDSLALFKGKVIHQFQFNDLPSNLMNQYLYLYRPE